MTKPRTWWVVQSSQGHLVAPDGGRASFDSLRSAEKLRERLTRAEQALEALDQARCDGCKVWCPRAELTCDCNLCEECNQVAEEEAEHRRELGEYYDNKGRR